MFEKILIANRGEIAVRIIRACRDLGIQPVCVYSAADREALHVKLSDEAYFLGPAPASESYLNLERIMKAALQSGAQALHPGYGFLAENAALARACESSGVTFIGPPAPAIETMGNKIASRKMMQKAGVPVIPGSEGPVKSPDEARALAREIGFPLMIKASAGGGGKGMRIVSNESELRSAFDTARGEAQSAFGDSTLFMEAYLERPRHIEVQLLADGQGNLVHLGERECSIQRRHQKLVEECPSSVVNPEFRNRLGEAAKKVAQSIDYENAGTVEFLVDTSGDPDDWGFYFLEMNTRLQVEHPVTELVTGLDLVREQILVAAGEKLQFRQEEVQLRGAALECRIYAEDPLQNFFPSPGTLTTLVEPAGPGIRIDSGVYEGFTIPIDYDPLISKLVAYGSHRGEAISRMRRALLEYKIGGVKTTIPFFDRLLGHDRFQAGDLHTHFIESHDMTTPEKASLPDFPAVAASLDCLLKEKQQRVSKQPVSQWKAYARRFWR